MFFRRNSCISFSRRSHACITPNFSLLCCINFWTVLQARWAFSNEMVSSPTVTSSLFAFDRLLSAQHLLRNFLQCERSSRLEALICFKKVRQLDLFVLVYLFLGRYLFLPFPRQEKIHENFLQQFSIIWLRLILLFAKLALCEAVSNCRLADLLPNTPDNV